MKNKLLIMLIIVVIFSGLPVNAASVNLNQSGVPSDWAKANLLLLTEYGVLDQWIYKTYQDPITRLDFIYLAVILYETIKGEEIAVNPNINFVDSSNIYVLKGATVGITSGIGDNKFGPDVKLTREQLATMMVKAIEMAGKTLTASSLRFDDDHLIAPYAKLPIYKAFNHKIINGYNNEVNPKGNASIEQALLIFKNIYDNFVLPSYAETNSKLNSEQIGNLAQSVVKIYVEDMDGNLSTGSGFFYESGKIATNFHVIDNAKVVSIEFDDGSKYTGEVKVLGYDIEFDLAALSINQSTVPGIKLGDSDKVTRGQNIYTIGSPAGLMNTLSNGLVSSIRNQIIQITAPISPGSSGGVLLDEYGAVIGITSSGIIEGENLGFAIPINIFKLMLKTHNYTLQEFVTKSNVKPPAVSFVSALSLTSSEVQVTWQDNGADYYYLYDLVNESEWYQIKNFEGGYEFLSSNSFGTKISGYKSGQNVVYAVAAVKNGIISDYTFSNNVLLQSDISTADEFELYLENGYSKLILNGKQIDLQDYSVMDFNSQKVSVFAYIRSESFTNYHDSEQLGLINHANDLKYYATQLKNLLGKDIVFIIIYADFYDFYPSGFVTNYLYSDSVTYNSNSQEWQVFYPLINVDTSSIYFMNWYSIYSY